MMPIEKCFFPIYFKLLFFLTTSYLTFMFKAYFKNKKISFVLPLLWKDTFMKDIKWEDINGTIQKLFCQTVFTVFKVNNKIPEKNCEICSKLTIKTID